MATQKDFQAQKSLMSQVQSLSSPKSRTEQYSVKNKIKGGLLVV